MRIAVCAALSVLVFSFANAAIAQDKAATPPQEDKADAKAVGSACYYNNQNITWYVSVRWPNSSSNFTLPPGGTHRLNNMNDQNTYECWSTSPMGSGCPNMRKTVINNCG